MAMGVDVTVNPFGLARAPPAQSGLPGTGRCISSYHVHYYLVSNHPCVLMTTVRNNRD